MVVQSFKHSNNLIKNYSNGIKPTLANNLDQKMVALHHPSKEEQTQLICVNDKNNISHFRHEQNSLTGWAKEDFPVQGAPDIPIDRLVSFYDSNEMAYLFAHYSQDDSLGHHKVLPMVRENDDIGWQPLTRDSNMENALGKMRQTDHFIDQQGNHFFYGISENFSPATFVLLGFNSETKKFQILFMEPLPDEDTSYRVTVGNNGAQMAICYIHKKEKTITIKNGSIENNTFKFSGENKTQSIDEPDLVAERFFPLKTSGDFLMSTSDDQLLLVTDFYNQMKVKPLLGDQNGGLESIQSISLGFNDSGIATVFAISKAQGTLWILRQDDSKVDQGVVFRPWVNLGKITDTITSPIQMGYGDEVFSYSGAVLERVLSHPISKEWRVDQLAVPHPDDKVSELHSFTQKISVVNKDGIIQSNSLVEISSDKRATVVINEISYILDPSRPPVRVRSNFVGSVVAYTEATDFSPPVLNIKTAEGVQDTFHANKEMYRRLAGKDPNFKVTGKSLKDAGIITASTPDDHAHVVAQCLQTLGSHGYSKMNSGKTKDGPFAVASEHRDVSYSFEFDDQGSLSKAELSRNKDTSTDFELSLGSFFHDVIFFFIHQAKKIRDFFVRVGKIIQVVINGVKFVIDKLVDISAAALGFLVKILSPVVNFIGDVLGTVMRWLLKAMHLDEAFDIQDGIIALIQNNLVGINKKLELKEAGHIIEEKFDDFKNDINNFFNNIEKKVAPDIKIKDHVKMPSGYSGQFKDITSLFNLASGGGLTFEPFMFLDKVINHMEKSGVISIPDSPDMTDAVRTFFKDEAKSFPIQELQASFQKVLDLLKEKLSDIKQFLEMTVVILLELIKDILLMFISFIEGFVIAIIDIIDSMIEAFGDALTFKLKIPFVTSFIKALTGKDATILNMCSFLMAVPLNLIMKIAQPFLKLDTPIADTLKSVHIEPYSLADLLRGNVKTTQPSALLQSSGKVDVRALEIVFILSAVCWFIVDTASVLAGVYASESRYSSPLTAILNLSSVVLSALTIVTTAVAYETSSQHPKHATTVLLNILLVTVFTGLILTPTSVTSDLEKATILTVASVITLIITVAIDASNVDVDHKGGKVKAEGIGDVFSSLFSPFAFMLDFITYFAAKQKGNVEVSIPLVVANIIGLFVGDLAPAIISAATLDTEDEKK